MEDEKTTEEIMACKSFEELEKVIKKRGPIISFGRGTPVTHNVDHILGHIKRIRENEDWPSNTITRACGLRATVERLLKESA